MCCIGEIVMILLKKIMNFLKVNGRSLTLPDEKIKAVHADDVCDFLKSIGEYEKILNGEIMCKYCGEKITLNNISTIFPSNREVCYCCNKDGCIERFLNERQK